LKARADETMGIDVHAVLPRDVRELVGHARATGDAVDEPLRAVQHAAHHPLRPAHLPQDVRVDAPAPAGALVGFLRLRDAAGDAVGHEFLVPLPRVRPWYSCGMIFPSMS
jgi:hypothetical protein